MLRNSWLLLIAGSWSLAVAQVASGQPTRVLIDTDIGSYLDDAFALALALASPELKIEGVTTVGGQAEDRAWLACRFISQCGHSSIYVAPGQSPQPSGSLDGQIQYRRHPAAVFNRTLKPTDKTAAELLDNRLFSYSQETIIALGPLTNIARLLKEYPKAPRRIKQIIVLGGSLKPAADGLPESEFNIKADIAAAQTVFSAGIPLAVVTADTAGQVRFTKDCQRRLFTSYRPLAMQLHNLFELHDLLGLHSDDAPLLFDPVAVAAACGKPFGTWREMSLTVDDAGRTLVTDGPNNCRVLQDLKVEEFLDWMTARLAADGEEILPRPATNHSQLLPLGKFPRRVHVCEDYNTDIERRWWMSGKPETVDVPQGGKRACRAVLTQDFDDRQGDTKTMYRAVIFNPVPGPPMGPNTRLSFRYKLSGTDEMRVQLFSLTDGYHRCLSLNGLPQGEWSHATVDMTAMHRPDGSGGPLAADERIDDIQFYIDPRGELLIDDVILYDAADENEHRPFPQRIIFTGWFDTGKQGKEWPGEFEIVPHERPRTWKFARSVPGSNGAHSLRVSLRGARQLPVVSELTFQYRLTGANSLSVALYCDGKSLGVPAVVVDPQVDEWNAAKCRFSLGESAAGSDGFSVDEIRFVIPPGGKLSIDDLLLYVP